MYRQARLITPLVTNLAYSVWKEPNLLIPIASLLSNIWLPHMQGFNYWMPPVQ
jgi:hypothetical protein